MLGHSCEKGSSETPVCDRAIAGHHLQPTTFVKIFPFTGCETRETSFESKKKKRKEKKSLSLWQLINLGSLKMCGILLLLHSWLLLWKHLPMTMGRPVFLKNWKWKQEIVSPPTSVKGILRKLWWKIVHWGWVSACGNASSPPPKWCGGTREKGEVA